jgi:phosphomannomutase
MSQLEEVRLRAEAWRKEDPDPNTANELAQLLRQDDAASLTELQDRFAGSLEFGTAGLRGILGAGPNRMNRAVVRRTTLGLARYLKKNVPGIEQRGVVVGRDGRRLSQELAEDTACVLAAAGIPAHVFPWVAPTPLIAFATLKLGAGGAVMVTASHNPPEYNGFKVYWENGAQIVPPHDRGIATEIENAGAANQVPLLTVALARQQGFYRDVPESIREDYLAAIDALRCFRKPEDLRIVYTAMHGVGGPWVEAALARAGFTHVHPVQEQHLPDGNFPTVRFPNPEEPGAMDLSRALAEKTNAELVLANDPDADRLAVMVRSPEGQWVQLSGNEVGVLLGHFTLSQGKFSKRPLVVTTIVSSAQLRAIAQDLGAAYEETLTGFKWIANRALEREKAGEVGFVFGYEEALGYSVGTVARDKDGVSAALVFSDLASWCKSRGTTVLGYLEEIQRKHGLFIATQRNFTFPGTQGQTVMQSIMQGFRKNPPARMGKWAVTRVLDYQQQAGLPPSNVIAFELEGDGRVTVRPSGTEPKIKYYFELKEQPAAGEPIAQARVRGERTLGMLVDSFLQLARERGQP